MADQPDTTPDAPGIPSDSPWAERPSTVNRWGNLTLLAEYRPQLWLTTMTGERYLADTAGGPRMMRLRCDCGHEFEIERLKFPGKRIARNCNRPECPYVQAAAAPKARERRGAAYSAYLPLEVAYEVEAYAEANGMRFSKALAILAHAGYELLAKPQQAEDK